MWNIYANHGCQLPVGNRVSTLAIQSRISLSIAWAVWNTLVLRGLIAPMYNRHISNYVSGRTGPISTEICRRSSQISNSDIAFGFKESPNEGAIFCFDSLHGFQALIQALCPTQPCFVYIAPKRPAQKGDTVSLKRACNRAGLHLTSNSLGCQMRTAWPIWHMCRCLTHCHPLRDRDPKKENFDFLPRIPGTDPSTFDEKEMTRVHQFYRARVEHYTQGVLGFF